MPKYKETELIIPKNAIVSIQSMQTILRGGLSTVNDTGEDIVIIIKESKDTSLGFAMNCKICGEPEMGFLNINDEHVKLCKDCVGEHLYMLKWK